MRYSAPEAGYTTRGSRARRAALLPRSADSIGGSWLSVGRGSETLNCQTVRGFS